MLQQSRLVLEGLRHALHRLLATDVLEGEQGPEPLLQRPGRIVQNASNLLDLIRRNHFEEDKKYQL